MGRVRATKERQKACPIRYRAGGGGGGGGGGGREIERKENRKRVNASVEARVIIDNAFNTLHSTNLVMVGPFLFVSI